MTKSSAFSVNCRLCPRLAGFLDEVRVRYPGYYARPVLSFGDSRPRLLVVGLAPGLHGANRTGRPFTGDHAGMLLYATLHRHGFATRPESVTADDALRLQDCRITNAVRCVPPANRPEPAEVRRCNPYLGEELAGLPRGAAVLALGNVAHGAVLRALGVALREHPFAHGAVHLLAEGRALFDSYHCSRYNTQTRRLTAGMFDAVFTAISRHIGS